MKTQNGSTTLILIIISAAILLYYVNSWKNITLLHDLTIKRYRYEKQFRATEALYNLGIAKCINDYDLISKNDSELIVFKGNWPPGQEDYQGFLKIKPLTSELFIEALTITIFNNDRFLIKANLTKEIIVDPKNKNKFLEKFTVKDWQIDAL